MSMTVRSALSTGEGWREKKGQKGREDEVKGGKGSRKEERGWREGGSKKIKKRRVRDSD